MRGLFVTLLKKYYVYVIIQSQLFYRKEAPHGNGRYRYVNDACVVLADCDRARSSPAVLHRVTAPRTFGCPDGLPRTCTGSHAVCSTS